MNADEEAGVLEALKHLRLKDIMLATSRFQRPSDELVAEGEKLLQQHKRAVGFSVGSVVEAEEEIEKRVFQVLVHLGTRVVSDSIEQSEAAPHFEIEAEFLVLYEMTGDIEEAALTAFANFNAVHNAWPFWRQHVFDIVQRGRLPQLEIPLFSGVKA